MDFHDQTAGLTPSNMNRLYQAQLKKKAAGAPVIDLISGNVTACGMLFPEGILRQIMEESLHQVRVYRPDSLGQPEAREAISAYYRRQGIDLPADHLLLTAGTSLSYLYCFRLLTEPGDEILCPTPTYPLFDLIARICGVELASYRLREERNWEIDLDYLEARLTTKTKAVVLISPHNPTGMVASQKQLEGLAEIAARHNLAIISDEVFSEFLFTGAPLPRPAATAAPLVLTLNGFSKMFALPGWKLGWIGVGGDTDRVRKSLETLELISDTFLPVNEMVQHSVPGILTQGQEFLSQYQSWVHRCRDLALAAVTKIPQVSCKHPAGSFYLTLALDSHEIDEEELAVSLLEKMDVLIHPGFFYEMGPSHLVMTFVQVQDLLQTAMTRIASHLEELCPRR